MCWTEKHTHTHTLSLVDLLKRVKKNKIHKPKGNLKKQKKNQHNVTIFKGEPSVERKREREH